MSVIDQPLAEPLAQPSDPAAPGSALAAHRSTQGASRRRGRLGSVRYPTLRLTRPIRIRRAESTPTSTAILWALAVIAALAAWLVLFGVGLSSVEEQHQQAGLYHTFRYELNGSGAPAPMGGAINEGAPVALLQSSAAGFHDLVVAEGTTSADLRSGPGHYPGTALPGQAGVSEIFGRGTSFGGPFRNLASLRPGDLITATTAQGIFHYSVEDVRAAGDPLPGPIPTGGSQLTLASADGASWSTGWAPKDVVFVDAVLRGAAQPAPVDLVHPRSADALLRGDGDSLYVYSLALWLQLLVASTIFLAWARIRWGHWQAWLTGVPLILAALWGASNALWVLLPNLL